MRADSAAADELTVQQLRSFCVVFDKQSYSEAARGTGLSVPTIWEQVRKLEKHYGTVLFEKRGRRIQSTPAAELLYESLRPLLTGLESTFGLLREGAGDFPGTLALVSGARIMMEDLGPPLRRFCDRYPGICLRLLHYNDQVASKMVASGEADLALTLEPGPGALVKDLAVERAYRIDYLAVLPRRHPLAQKRTLRLVDLAAYPLIVGHRGTYVRQLFEQIVHREGLTSQVRFAAETDTSAFTVSCVRAGMGVGVIGGREGGFLCRGLVVRSLSDELGSAWTAFRWKKGKHLTPTVRTLMRMIREAMHAEDEPGESAGPGVPPVR